MRLDKEDVARLLEGMPFPDMVNLWPVAVSYRILGGEIYADNPQPIFVKDSERYSDTIQSFANPDLFFSFAQLGVRGEPSEKSILRWVSKHGLLERANEKDGVLLIDEVKEIRLNLSTANLSESQLSGKDLRGADFSFEVNQAPITVERFRTEVLCAHQLLTLYMDIKEENFAALQDIIYGTADQRHLSSYWPHTPPTDLEKHFAYNTEIYSKKREIMLRARKYVVPGPDDPERSTFLGHLDVGKAIDALQTIVRNYLANVRLDFVWSWFSFQPWMSDYRMTRSWYCPDLLSAMYLQFYLLITDFEPMRRCENPACGMPFPATRKNKRFCNATCRSNARNYR